MPIIDEKDYIDVELLKIRSVKKNYSKKLNIVKKFS